MSTASERAYLKIRELLLEGRFSAGERLSEEELADTCGVSRTPVREALRRLALESFVVIHPNRGAFVVDWGRDDIADLFELRAMLEGFAAYKAALRRSQAQANQLIEFTEEMHRDATLKGRRRIDRFLELNRQFHDLICEAAGNARLKEFIARLVEQAIVVRTAIQYSTNDLRRSDDFHRDIARAIEAQNGPLAEQLMRAHILAASDLYRDSYLDGHAASARVEKAARRAG